jgi:hypothetical protein
MYVKTIIILVAIIGILVLYLLLRGRSNGSTVRDNNDSIDKLKTETGSARDTNNKSRKVTGDIRTYNNEARAGIDEAINILKEAKDRSNT